MGVVFGIVHVDFNLIHTHIVHERTYFSTDNRPTGDYEIKLHEQREQLEPSFFDTWAFRRWFFLLHCLIVNEWDLLVEVSKLSH